MALFAVGTVFTLLMLQTYVAVRGVTTPKLHEHMTKREIEYFFNVDDHDEVPEYHVTSPYQSNDAGDFVSYSLHPTREKRSTGEALDHSFYKLDAFGSKLHLKLKKNDHLMAPGMRVSRENSDGTVTSHSAPENTFYLGNVVSDPQSMVAVKNDGGLTGMVKTSRDTLFVHHLPPHLAKHVTSSDDETTPHLVYRRSLREENDSFINDVLHPETEDEEKSRTGRSLDSEDSGIPVPKFKTLKVALMCPTFFAERYSSGNLNSTTGGVENFLLMIANMVAGFFQDASFGEIKLTYVVTEINIIDPENYGFSRHATNAYKLTKLIRRMKNETEAQKVHYNVFSYVSNQVKGGALANLNSICKKAAGSVNQDVGLQTALHIAHETGHNLGAPHDSGTCAANAYLMKSSLPSGTYAHKWSECSKNVFQRLLKDSKRSACLDDPPPGDHPALPARFRHKLPGTIIDGNAQCELIYGNGWKRYDTTKCKELYCLKDLTKLSRGVSVLDGTTCGLNKWCISGTCEHRGFTLMSFDGGWSKWSSYSNCTHECGGGVQYKRRICNNPKPLNGKGCKGEENQYKICNKQECPSDEKDYKQTLCDQKLPNTKAYYNGRDTCSVYCRAGNTAIRIGTVPNGYRCTRNKKDYSVCISGKCRRVGCDHLLDTQTMEDRCGECGKDGNSCRRVVSRYTDSPSQSGPDNAALVTELPVGTKGAFFMVEDYTYDYLGVQDAKGNYIVGGHLGKDQTKLAAGTVIHYRRKIYRKRKGSRDIITIAEPTHDVLKVVYAKKNDKSGGNPGVSYHYLILGQQESSSAFKWVSENWSTCSRTCAVGIRRRNVRCVRVDDETPASDSACPGQIPKVEECNTQPCEAKWVISKWSDCSKTCGRGKQERSVRCLAEVAANDFRESNSCLGKTTNLTSQVCNRYPCPARWFTGNWSACSTQCAIGTKHRQVLCSRINEFGNFSVIDYEFCRYLDKPPSETLCNEDSPCGPRGPVCPNDHLCLNGGTCIPDPAGYKCVCDRGFTGPECEIKLDPCEKNPCLNGGTCSMGVFHHYDHTCQCLPQFTGGTCETKVTACMSDPCLNGAPCTDDGSYDKYACACPDEFVGEQCQVSKFYHIGCFNHDANVIPALERRRRELDINKVSAVVINCAELAQESGYNYFSVGYKGVCYSGPQANETYFKKGPAETKKKCSSGGVGKKGAAVVYTFESVPSYESLGCFRANKRRKKALRRKYMNFGNQGNKKEQTTIDQCARIAQAEGYTYFAVQNTAECWSDEDAENRYDMLGKCTDGAGLKGKSMVYRLAE